jgi:choice-of-anchor B domain-containing protein
MHACRSCRPVLFALVLVTLPGLSPARGGDFSADKVALYRHFSLQEFQANSAMDCWGYVSASGREYAIIGLSTGTRFVEITDPSNAVSVGHVPHSRGAKDIKVYRDYVYSSTDSGPTHIIDVSDIDNGNIVHVKTISQGTHNLAVNEESGYLYLARGGPMLIWDLADPVNPVHVGTWPDETHDAQVVTYTEGPYAGREIAFVFAGWSRRLDILDVTSKGSIQVLGSTSYPDAGYTHQGWLSEDRRYLYVDDELDEINNGTTTRTLVVDVQDLTRPTLVNDFTTGLPATDHNLYVRDGFIYEANYSSGLRIFDTRQDPTEPVEAGYFDTYPDDDTRGYGKGAWTAYPFFPSGTVIVSDVDYGLFVLDVREAIGQGPCVRDPAWVCDADVDGNGAVNPVDKGLIEANFCTVGDCSPDALCQFDLDCNGTVNPVDSGIVQSLFGQCDIPRVECP